MAYSKARRGKQQAARPDGAISKARRGEQGPMGDSRARRGDSKARRAIARPDGQHAHACNHGPTGNYSTGMSQGRC
eukprot:4128065-Prymnesium_polylepis.1